MEWQGAVTGAIAALVGRILFDWLQPRRSKTNGDSGSRSVEYTHAEVRRAVKAELDSFEDRHESSIREIVRKELDVVIRSEFDRDPRRR